MAGIKEAMKRVMEHRNEGRVVAMGVLKECSCGEEEVCSECSNTKYMIVKLKPRSKADKVAGHAGIITVYDYGSDILIADDIELLDNIMLMIHNNWQAEWIKTSGVAFPDRLREEELEKPN